LPFTPLHFGPALLLFSLFLALDPLALFLGSVAVDSEGVLGLFFEKNLLLQDCSPSCILHGPLHSLVGGTAVASLLAIALIHASKKIPEKARRFLKTKNEKTILASSLAGVYSHLLLDSFIYPEMNLAWPFSYWNPFLGSIGSFELYWFCAISFLFGALLLLFRKMRN